MDDPLTLPATSAAPDAVTYRQIPGGFLRYAYGEDGRITLVSAVRTATTDSEAIGPELYFLRGSIDDEAQITFKTRMGLGGQVFSRGAMRYATVYDDDGPSEWTTIAKDVWLRTCLTTMAQGLLTTQA